MFQFRSRQLRVDGAQDRPRTLFLSENYPPLLGGTANKFSARFVDCTEDDVSVITRRIEGSEQFDSTVRYRVTRIDLPHRGISGFEWLSDAFRFVRAGRKLRVDMRFDVVECARPIPEGFAGWVLCKLWRVPLVVNVQGEDINVMKKYRVERRVMRGILRAARVSIANSQFTQNLIDELAGPKARTTVIPPGLRHGIENWSPSAERVSELRHQIGGGPILLTAGRLQARKGQDNVVRALPIIRDVFSEVRYVVVGSEQGGTPQLREKLAQLAQELGVSENVRIVGEVSNDDLAAYYLACDLFAMPNRCQPGGDVEGFGQVFVEAGHFGKAVVGGRSGGVPDAVKDEETGLLVDGTSPQEIAAAVLRLLRDDQLRDLFGRNGRKHAKSLRRESVAEMYRQVMSSTCGLSAVR